MKKLGNPAEKGFDFEDVVMESGCTFKMIGKIPIPPTEFEVSKKTQHMALYTNIRIESLGIPMNPIRDLKKTPDIMFDGEMKGEWHEDGLKDIHPLDLLKKLDACKDFFF